MKLPKNQKTVLNCGHRLVTGWLKMTNPYYANYLENQQALQKILEEA